MDQMSNKLNAHNLVNALKKMHFLNVCSSKQNLNDHFM